MLEVRDTWSMVKLLRPLDLATDLNLLYGIKVFTVGPQLDSVQYLEHEYLFVVFENPYSHWNGSRITTCPGIRKERILKNELNYVKTQECCDIH
ncbi:hypothetical protein T265_08409 [Opisthorchis viverrini]|uniref:Uncharacterized protein n=1 Tax=Opisthorchis viverrini TaxID=6198 RepID=A0A074Z9J9_OPIVI|nr:hypothetical protein T265_08409 [Opisthorchis viverrini]KER23788.1 hypothetical protein T265_08409 [Opisthorchis viverrini]